MRVPKVPKKPFDPELEAMAREYIEEENRGLGAGKIICGAIAVVVLGLLMWGAAKTYTYIVTYTLM